MDDHVFVEYFAHANTLATEPVAVGDAMDVAIDRPRVKEGVHNGILGEDTEAGAKDATKREKA